MPEFSPIKRAVLCFVRVKYAKLTPWELNMTRKNNLYSLRNHQFTSQARPTCFTELHNSSQHSKQASKLRRKIIITLYTTYPQSKSYACV